MTNIEIFILCSVFFAHYFIFQNNLKCIYVVWHVYLIFLQCDF